MTVPEPDTVAVIVNEPVALLKVIPVPARTDLYSSAEAPELTPSREFAIPTCDKPVPPDVVVSGVNRVTVEPNITAPETPRPDPILTLPETPRPPTTIIPPDVEDVEFVLFRNVDMPVTPRVPET